MGKLAAAFAALRYGSSLTDPAIWKQRQTRLNALVGLLGALVVLLPVVGVKIEVTSEDVLAIAGGIAAVVGLFVNPYLTTATSDKVGLPAGNPPADRPSADAGSDRPDDLYRGA